MKKSKRHAKSASQLDREIAEALSAPTPRRASEPKHEPPETPLNRPLDLPMVQVKMTKNGPQVGPQVLPPDARPINPLKTLRRLDHDAAIALIARQRELHQQLAGVAEALLTQVGKAHDHAAGFRHAPETCANCATIEKEQR